MATVIVQRAFRARNDDGTEATATWKAAENVSVSVAAGGILRVRYSLEQTSGTTANTYQLTYNKNGAGANNVTAASSVIRAHSSAFVADGTATTVQLAATNAGSYIAGAVDTADGVPPAVSQSSVTPKFTEEEYCIEVRAADVSPGDTIVVQPNSVNTYDFTLTITVSAAPSTDPVYGERNSFDTGSHGGQDVGSGRCYAVGRGRAA